MGVPSGRIISRRLQTSSTLALLLLTGFCPPSASASSLHLRRLPSPGGATSLSNTRVAATHALPRVIDLCAEKGFSKTFASNPVLCLIKLLLLLLLLLRVCAWPDAECAWGRVRAIARCYPVRSSVVLPDVALSICDLCHRVHRRAFGKHTGSSSRTKQSGSWSAALTNEECARGVAAATAGLAGSKRNARLTVAKC